MKRIPTRKSKRIASMLAAAGIALAAALTNTSGVQAARLPSIAIILEGEAEQEPSDLPPTTARIGWGGCGGCGQ